MKKNIYLIQADFAYGDSVKSVYLPYAAGLLAAYAFRDETVKNNCSLARIVFTREEIAAAVSSFDRPFLAGFSNYVWNFEYNKLFAEKLKESHPECVVIFGGHNVPPGAALLEQYPFIDILVHGEGEEAFRCVLAALCAGGGLADIPNISYREDGVPRSTRLERVVCPLENYPSPYLEGVFDDLIRDNKDFRFSAILETSRDCPFVCAFCDWGQLRAKTRRFSHERVFREIEWFARHSIGFVYGADANFGIFNDDLAIAEKMVEAKRATGCPRIFSVNYSKTKAENVFQISLLLFDAGMNKGVPLSFQSLSPEVLKNIGRENMDLNHFSKLIAKYNEAGVTAYSELILGLPGETCESFCRGVGALLEAGQHRTINVYGFELLVNSKLLRAKSVWRVFYYIPVVTSAVAISMVWVWMYHPQAGLMNAILQGLGLPRSAWLSDPLLAMPAIIVMAVWQGAGWSMVVYLAGLQGIPESLYEAARIDGASSWQQFTRVTLPLLSPVTLFIVIIGCISALQVFAQVFVMTGGGPLNATITVTYNIWQQGFRHLRMGYSSAMSFLLFLIILAMSVLNNQVFGGSVEY